MPDACCTIEEGKKRKNIRKNEEEHAHSFGANPYVLAGISFVLLLLALSFEHVFKFGFLREWIKTVIYVLAYLPVGFPVLIKAVESIQKGSVFTEFFLMSIATLGAFLIGEYPEGVAVMLFYAVGELLQHSAVTSAKNNINALLEVRPKTARVYRNGSYREVNPETVALGEKLQVQVGEKIPIDGKLLSKQVSLNTSALTGESKPMTLQAGDKVLAGSINLSGVIEIETEKSFDDSSAAKIIDLVQNASAKKAKTELLIRKLAKVYTPIVTYLAIAIVILPYFFADNYIFYDWLYSALIFLVISCPCALVISIPLGYFGGLGAASKNGILFKGANYMDLIAKVNTFVMDKTGTLTKSVFSIKDLVVTNGMPETEFMKIVLSLESKSSHPIAKAIMSYHPKMPLYEATEVREISGKGLRGSIDDQEILVGNKKLLSQFDIAIPAAVDAIVESIVLVGINNRFAGYITFADELREDAIETIRGIQALGIKDIVMLSGDKPSITQKVAKDLNISKAKGGLLPENKLNEVLTLKNDPTKVVSFIGDGINDAPVLAASDLGIAMGAIGSDAAIETADVIFQTDEPSKFITARKISKSTQQVIWQNIFLAFGVKILVLISGVLGMATMWQAVISDVGVSFLAILNAVRLQHMKW